MNKSFLFLNRQTILSLFNPPHLIQLIEQTLYSFNSFNCFVPNRLTSSFNNHSIITMPVFSSQCLGCKVLTITPNNIYHHIPSIFGLMILFDTNGFPLCLLDGSTLTSIRTGGIGGLAIDLLTPQNVDSVGLIGCGVQGYYQLLFACSIRKFSTIYLFNFPEMDLSPFILKLSNDLLLHNIHHHIHFVVCSSSTDVVLNSQVIITATTSSKPVLPDTPLLYLDKTIIAIGSYLPTSRELPDAVFNEETSMFIEMDYAKKESGDILIPLKSNKLSEENIHYLIDVKRNKSLKRRTNIFKSVGMALYDNIVGYDLYRNAKEKNIGKELIL
ncbi:ornithine cyclodeaminase, putative [Entamoeba histolytica HM-1:IMSS-B]|nr:ornithine cyclodeaminase, putative [Entamoeba histolytica KU27]EMH72781.1 ornithine cyclodeaminase, putative [Entamoeba histolytica HM-1:IMSS-B]ENY64436.1 ornithine cyclodeaminase, putative [Entamoeba histolytica HM-1:IMSS-A]GAT98896.1 ornithine cyclodeaminase putative [Entamoeba histolytica]